MMVNIYAYDVKTWTYFMIMTAVVTNGCMV